MGRALTTPPWRTAALQASRCAFVLAALLAPARAFGQACCAGAGAATPGRLALHENALVGARVTASSVFGSFSSSGSYQSAPASSGETDFEQALFGAARVVPRAQVAALVPWVETRRVAGKFSEWGGGIGDINVSARYDFVLAGASSWMPGVAALAGVTFPTGTAVDAAQKPLATDATGIGAYQGNIGLSIEQTTGPWLLGASALVAKRTSRTVRGITTTLGSQWTFLATAAYTFPSDAALALVATYTVEGNARETGDAMRGELPHTGRRNPRLNLSGVYPLSDHLRLQGGAFVVLPIGDLGQNQPADGGLTWTVVYSWS